MNGYIIHPICYLIIAISNRTCPNKEKVKLSGVQGSTLDGGTRNRIQLTMGKCNSYLQNNNDIYFMLKCMGSFVYKKKVQLI